jgi:hypothetical protein
VSDRYPIGHGCSCRRASVSAAALLGPASAITGLGALRPVRLCDVDDRALFCLIDRRRGYLRADDDYTDQELTLALLLGST